MAPNKLLNFVLEHGANKVFVFRDHEVEDGREWAGPTRVDIKSDLLSVY